MDWCGSGVPLAEMHASVGAVGPPNRTAEEPLRPLEEPNKLLHAQIRPVVFKVLFNSFGVLL